MRICILGSFAGRLDEGMVNVSYYLSSHLRPRYPELTLLNVEDVKKLQFWKSLFHIKPHIIHLIPGPTLRGMIFVKLIQVLTHSKSIISATQPVLPKYFKIFASILKPDIVLVQSEAAEVFFKNLNYKTIFIPNGVDVDKFAPADIEKKNEIRKRYGFDENDFILLHIGPIKQGRNQKSLLKIKDAKILIVASITSVSEQKARDELAKSNVIIWNQYFKNIQEVYVMSDVYVFPVFEKLNSIEIPLSVLEAMSCNLPVITTRYGALGRILEEGDGLFFIEREEQLSELIPKIKNGDYKINTRNKIQSLSWQNVSSDIAKLYEAIYVNKGK